MFIYSVKSPCGCPAVHFARLFRDVAPRVVCEYNIVYRRGGLWPSV